MFFHSLSPSLTPSHRLLLVSSHYFSSRVIQSYGLYSVSFVIVFSGASPPRFSSPYEEAVFNLGRENKASAGADLWRRFLEDGGGGRDSEGGGDEENGGAEDGGGGNDVSGGEDGNNKGDIQSSKKIMMRQQWNYSQTSQAKRCTNWINATKYICT